MFFSPLYKTLTHRNRHDYRSSSSCHHACEGELLLSRLRRSTIYFCRNTEEGAKVHFVVALRTGALFRDVLSLDSLYHVGFGVLLRNAAALQRFPRTLVAALCIQFKTVFVFVSAPSAWCPRTPSYLRYMVLLRNIRLCSTSSTAMVMHRTRMPAMARTSRAPSLGRYSPSGRRFNALRCTQLQ